MHACVATLRRAGGLLGPEGEPYPADVYLAWEVMAFLADEPAHASPSTRLVSTTE